MIQFKAIFEDTWKSGNAEINIVLTAANTFIDI